MSDSTLCTAGDYAQSEKLHRAFAEAERKRQEAQPRIDQAADAYETACLHRHAAGSLCDGTPQARIEALDAEVGRTKAERDRTLAEAETPYRAALQAMLDHDRHFVNAATSWLGAVLRTYASADERLVAKCQPARRELTDMGNRRASLRSIAEYFGLVFAEVSAWRLPQRTSATYGVHPAERFDVPRLSDWLEKK